MNLDKEQLLNMVKRAGALLGTVFIIALCVAIGPLDYFYHGFYSTHVGIDEIDSQDIDDTVDLGDIPVLLCEFTPTQSHFAGFELYLANRKDLKEGVLELEVRDSGGRVIGSASVDLSQTMMTSWCHPEIEANLIEGQSYFLYASSYGCFTKPKVQVIDQDYLGEEILDGDVLLGVAYQKQTFSVADKGFIISILLCAWGSIAVYLVFRRKEKRCLLVCVICTLGAFMCWNYSTSILDAGNEQFRTFQADSEALATGVMETEIVGNVQKTSGYGLGWLTDAVGTRKSWEKQKPLNEENWKNGFSKTEPIVLVSGQSYIRSIATVGSSIRFKNGSEFEIISLGDEKGWLALTLATDEPLNEAKLGPLADIAFISPSGEVMESGQWIPYKSQYGLQGKLLKRFSRLFDDYALAVEFAHWLCALLLALVLMGIVYLVYKKYNLLLASCFYIVFLLSPWIVDFAKNLYWVEFTWFLPMLIGLYCSIAISKVRARFACYCLTCFAVLIKCLCGYEYISTIIIAAVAFIVADLIQALFQKNRNITFLCLRAIIGLGFAAVVGFFVAMMFHAVLRGNGDILNGVFDIFQRDVLRRTDGGTLDAFEERNWESLNASKWETVLNYFNFYKRFDSEVITGIAGNLFPIICLAPLVVLFFDVRSKEASYCIYALYFTFFLAALSWFVLAKSHSYVHTHMNYVLWYFGFVQMCLYILLDKARRYVMNISFSSSHVVSPALGDGLVENARQSDEGSEDRNE